MKDLIFEKPSLAPLPQRVGWAFFTALFWILWIYLWLPLITLFVWIGGFYSYGDYYADVKMQNEIGSLRHLIAIYTIVILAMGASLLLWARIEFIRFHKVNRRSRPVPVTAEELAAYASLPQQEVAAWQSTRRVVMQHDDHGHVVGGIT
ncbi:MAG: poly-beta-1,6-N-acetyl-D-glucosamine biosynthesis protein PgaD [Burkholderiales bacterium]|nr:poly-beta-1,6-N-acetyl-D-glucosamine biosynthesis protein PgaD [Burkholderiales bacterium]